MSRRKRVRLSAQRELPKDLPPKTIKLQFLNRMLQERRAHEGSDTSGAGAVSEDTLYARGHEASADDKHAFMSAIMQLQSEWWLREMPDEHVAPSGGTTHSNANPGSILPTRAGSHLATTKVPNAVALVMDVDCMTEQQRKDTILHLRRIVLQDACMRRRALESPDAIPFTLVPPATTTTVFPTVGRAAGSVAALRSTSTGEVFEMPEKQYHIGMDVVGLPMVNLDLTKLNPPQTPEKLNAVIFYHDKAKYVLLCPSVFMEFG